MLNDRKPFIPVAVLCLAGAVSGLMGCESSEETLSYSGATTLLPVISRAAEAFEVRYPGIRVEVQGGGTSKGILDVTTGTADIAGAARDLTDAELLLVNPIPLARDGLAIIVNRRMDLTDIGLAELTGLYSESVAPRLNDREVTRVAKAAAHGTAQAFARGIGVDIDKIVGDVVAGSNGEVIAVVSATGSALGYVSHADAKAAIEAGAPIRIVAVDGVLPSPEVIRDGTYPLVRTLYLALKRPGSKTPLDRGPPETARTFVAFMESPMGTQLILDSGFVAGKGVDDADK